MTTATTTEGREVELTVRCRPWSSRIGHATQGVDDHRVLVELGAHPRVRVWDPIGCIWTVCHSLSARTEARIIRRALAEVQS